eukprot:6621260-Pyramimonas_sp.AAC.1
MTRKRLAAFGAADSLGGAAEAAAERGRAPRRKGSPQGISRLKFLLALTADCLRQCCPHLRRARLRGRLAEPIALADGRKTCAEFPPPVARVAIS